MKKINNIVQLQGHRELDSRYAPIIQEKFLATPDYIRRLGLYGELDSHTGCVNCLEWSTDGRVLASGSDDVHIVLWDPFKKKQLQSIPTGHNGNIFTVKFLPNSENRKVVSGAADYSVRIHDAVSKDLIGICTCHTNRVKRCVTDPMSPDIFWTAGEDGVIIQHDSRASHTCPAIDVKSDRNILIDLKRYIGAKAEAKCMAVNPVKTDHIAIGANDPFVRIYDRRMIKMVDTNQWEIEQGAVQYFVPGHLPSKVTEYKRKYRSLASTYITFSPDGKELLVNLGGEQIYLFPLVDDLKTKVSCLTIPAPVQTKENHTNGYSNGYKNGTTSVINNHFDIFCGMRPIKRPSEKVILSPFLEKIKDKANQAFKEKKYAKAVHIYNEALKLCPYSAILYGNRAAALLKRSWDGDVYAALKDCQIAIFLDADHFKALLRLGRCLLDLKRYKESAECLKQFKNRFPENANAEVYKALDQDLTRAMIAEKVAAEKLAAENSKKDTTITSNNNSPSTSAASTSSEQQQTPTASAFLRSSGDCVLRFHRNSTEVPEGPDNNENNRDDDGGDDDDLNEELSVESSNIIISSDSNSSSPVAGNTTSKVVGAKKPDFHDCELKLREKAVDFRERYCGHCNTTTDIKEANFFGGYIVAGSDDGSFFIWDRETTNIVKIVKGDESIVNCLQPHPSTCMLATSGIESVVRLWAPMPEEGYVNDRVVDDVNDAAYANQKRMNSNPFEVILLNMGYRISGAEDDADEEDASMPCNPS